MSEQTPFDFGKLMPGFDFLRQLAGGGTGTAGAATGLGHWVAPTISVEELDQRITELKAVQFWLEQNLLALKATVQALEVQKMTLVALHGMNIGMGEIAKAFTLPEAEVESKAEPAASSAPGWPYTRSEAPAPPVSAGDAEAPAEGVAAADHPEPRAARRTAGARKPAAASAASAMTDPMQWWGALTQQFQQLATEALREAAQVMPGAEPEAAPTGTRKPAGAKSAAAKKPAARKSAGGKTATRKKAAPRQKARKEEAAAPAPGVGWPLPSPFKSGSR
ncbi:MAG TPA: hypothetical protein PKA16_11475 [Ottowia sp.]|uniref:PhaM family polyhydroxyalkanoate granule multifunctional regulatory protein n=1 Tax=Ottowia sp. TaxID=1898956 RepID=UPI002D076834|nr:PhaM family polyhydroxyalkanoate granule multifunctional regulatory protein [Ottowia sp.]HMN21997.1 hypothetical protein [Ottowia sp.]